MNNDELIYVAGHRGLVGSAIVRRLQQAGYTNLLLRTSAELDLTDQAAVRAFFAEHRPAYVFLAAARVGGILANDTYPADFIRDNLAIELNVIDSAHRTGVKKLLFLGSSCIYPKHAPQPMAESCLLTGPLEPTNQWYAVAKIAGIKLCQAYRRQYGWSAISLMPTNLYGPNDNYDLETSHVLPALIRKFHLAKLALAGDLAAIAADEARHGPIPDTILAHLGLARTARGLEQHGEPTVLLWGTGSAKREFLHVDDLADACLFLMDHYDDEEIINVGTGTDTTIRDLAALVQAIVGYHGRVEWDTTMPDGTPRKLLDLTRLHALGWHAAISLEEGITRVYQNYCRAGDTKR